MKKRLITVLLLSMIICVVGCGKTEETIKPTIEADVEATVEETTEESIIEETTVEEVDSTVEETTVEETTEEVTTEEVVEEPTSASNSTAQIIKLLDAYTSILTTDTDFLIQMVQDNCETFCGKFDFEAGKFADGKSCETSTYSIFSIAIEYYENCLAGNEPWDTATWMAEQASEEFVKALNFNGDTIEEGYETKLFEAIYICPYLINQSSIELTNRIETDEYKFIKGEVSAYTYDLVLNGQTNTDFKAIYDSEGNLLTIDIPDDFVLESYSFDNSIWEVRE